MNRASMGLAAVAGLMLLMLTFGGVCFLAVAGYLALAAHMIPWAAALVVAGVLLLPLFAAVSRLLWSARRRRLQRHGFGAFKAALLGSAKADPYGLVGGAFMFGMTLAASPAMKERIAGMMAACKGEGSGLR